MNGAIRSTRVLVGSELRPATVVWAKGVISDVVDHSAGPADAKDHRDLVIMPALVDSHVHVNEPGRTEWEGFATATAAGRAGGIAVIVDMPLNSIPPTTTVDALAVKRKAAAAADLGCDVAFWGGVIPGNLDEIAGLAAAGVRGFKCFLADSGVPEFPPIEFGDLVPAMKATAAVKLPLLVHAESPAVLAASPQAGPTHASWVASRPESAETEAIAAVIAAARKTGAQAHILHLSAASAIPSIAAARKDGVAISAETCPHYLTLTTDETGDDCAAKCAPPIRDAANRDLLWEGLASGEIDMVVSDHSPCPGELKAGGFHQAWGGIASIELRLPLVWTAAHRRGFGIADLSRWISSAPASLAGIPTGTIRPGMRADLVVWDPDATVTVEPKLLAQRHPITPYAGWRLQGKVMATIVRGGSPPALLPEAR